MDRFGRRPTNLPALHEIGFSANRRLLTSNDSATTRCSAATVTPSGHKHALFLIRTQGRRLRDRLADPAPNRPPRLRGANTAYDRAIHDLLHRAGLPA